MPLPLFAPHILAQADPGTWFGWIDKNGLATVIVVAVAIAVTLATRAVWYFFKPHISGIADDFRSMIAKQSEFIDTLGEHQQDLKRVIELGQNEHQKTHYQLAAINKDTSGTHDKVREIHAAIVQRVPRPAPQQPPKPAGDAA